MSSSRDVVILDGRGLRAADVAAVARAGAAVELDAAARERNAAAAAALSELLERGEPVYGVTTGVGGFRSREVAPSERPGQQLRLLRSHACGGGRLLAPELVRAAMVVRANQLGAGGAGVSDELLGALVTALNAGFVPAAHELGSLGTGDLTVLAEIALALLGEGRVWRGDAPLPTESAGERFGEGRVWRGDAPLPTESAAGRFAEGRARRGDALLPTERIAARFAEGRISCGDALVSAEEALAEVGLMPPELGPRDGIAFMSSSAATIGHAALVAVDAELLMAASLRVAALAFIAAGADPLALDERVQAARPHPGQVEAAARLRELVGSERDAPTRDPGAPIHDPYPFRALPQVEGAALDALRALEDVLAVELNAAAENALVDAAAPAALPTANFHAGALALALDRLRAALAQSSSLVAARVSALLDPALMGLPAALSSNPGPSSGAMMLEYTAHAAAADVRVRASPVTSQTTTVGGGVESHASFAPIAARLAQDALESAGVAVATELVLAVRALRIRGLEPSGTEPAALFADAAARLDADLSDRALSEDIEAARRLLFDEGAAATG